VAQHKQAAQAAAAVSLDLLGRPLVEDTGGVWPMVEDTGPLRTRTRVLRFPLSFLLGLPSCLEDRLGGFLGSPLECRGCDKLLPSSSECRTPASFGGWANSRWGWYHGGGKRWFYCWKCWRKWWWDTAAYRGVYGPWQYGESWRQHDANWHRYEAWQTASYCYNHHYWSGVLAHQVQYGRDYDRHLDYDWRRK
jgi:hypothetical protein